jgi:hypothetical protein
MTAPVLGIHDVILEKLQTELTTSMITNVSDATKAGVVKIGPLQGDPDVDTARISITVSENDPEAIIKGGVSGMSDGWNDEVTMIEIGGAITTRRAFTIKGRCLFADTKENLDLARQYASQVRQRLEETLTKISFTGIVSGSEYVARGIYANDIKSEMLQSGGPPDTYDYHIKIRFSVLTTRTGAMP